MITKITIVRHGQSTGNATGHFTGQVDVPLSARGRQEAELTAQRLATEQLTAIYASDLQRAYHTAEIVAANHPLTVQQDLRLREINVGAFQGQSFLAVAAQYPVEFAALSQRNLDMVAPGGESHRQVRMRVITAFQEILAACAGGHVLIVAHGGVIFHLNHFILGLPETAYNRVNYRIGNCSLHRYELLDDERWRIVTINDESHLRELNIDAATVNTTDITRVSERIFGCS
jgi:2,3-bisphosphoglycerate-dependent phosphoglycerate mutase